MNKLDKEEVEHVILRIKDCRYLNRKIININNKLEEIATSLVGVSSPAIKGYIIENKTPYSHYNRLDMMMKEERLIKERDCLADQIKEYETLIENLDEDVKKLVVDLYILRKRHNKVASEYYYTRQGMYDKINRCILKNLQCK